MPAIASTRSLPPAQSLSDAVREVIQSNSLDGYQPHRFAGVTQGGNAPNLIAVCRKLINDAETLAWLEKELSKIPTLLTIEDYVWRYGSQWGFDPATINMAHARAVRFDQVAAYTRYA